MADETPQEPGYVVPAHGKGKLLTGGKPGNRGGGKPSTQIRKKMARIFEQDGVKFVRDVLRGEIEGASTADRLRAVDLAGKYGIGLTKAMNVDAVRDRLQQTIEVTAEHLPALIEALPPEEVAAALFELWEPIWQ